MIKSKIPLVGAGQADQQGASNNYLKYTLSSLVGQGEASQGNSAASQRQRILAHLRENGSLTTLSARGQLDICHPGMLLCELRKAGYRIQTIWVFEAIAPGKPMHRIANYILRAKHPVQLSLLYQLEGDKK